MSTTWQIISFLLHTFNKSMPNLDKDVGLHFSFFYFFFLLWWLVSFVRVLVLFCLLFLFGRLGCETTDACWLTYLKQELWLLLIQFLGTCINRNNNLTCVKSDITLTTKIKEKKYFWRYPVTTVRFLNYSRVWWSLRIIRNLSCIITEFCVISKLSIFCYIILHYKKANYSQIIPESHV